MGYRGADGGLDGGEGGDVCFDEFDAVFCAAWEGGRGLEIEDDYVDAGRAVEKVFNGCET